MVTTGVTFDSDSVAVVSYTLTYNNGTRESHLQKVVNTGDGWKLRIVEQKTLRSSYSRVAYGNVNEPKEQQRELHQ